MGETKKRRQTKHRGNAAGMVEAAGGAGGSGGRNGSPSTTGGGKRGPRVPQPASWNKAMVKGAIPLVIFAVFLIFSSKGKSIVQILTLLVIVYALYVPVTFYTDRWMYNRYVKRGR